MVRDPLIPRLVSVPEAAEILGLRRSRVHQLVTEGKLPGAWSGNTIVLAEETVLRYKAGERFGFPSVLAIFRYNEDADGWVAVDRRAVAPDYELPDRFGLEDIGGNEGELYRVELLDNQGKTLAVKTVDVEAAS
ncbi:DNA binding domain-containing protein, excisionase family [Amycolatopsis arida]|uniref:DNA binding domain-containing protein, excisionase family n=1 Tax=Amycolatopsis arida TaxID=587909 RepID=A0A1I5KDN9_9PSEU|nr:helix-turn-helix domain-containing protein [Amycolatopsis arida]TDX96998.1 excisionase family DNA binding protein [Amycolatopsis arida]SFO83129.1 DNA binding domain-containing protein, excisionase family [Amycolatopsis arida]